MTTITLPRAVVEQALEALKDDQDRMVETAEKHWEYKTDLAITALRAALAEPVLAPAPGYCKHCKQYTIEEPLPAEPVQEPVEPLGQLAELQAMLRAEVDRLIAAGIQPQRKPLPNHDQHCVDVPGYGLMAVRLARAVERAHKIGEGA